MKISETKHNHLAFTLTDLLIVIATVFILFALVVFWPMPHPQKEQAVRIHCMSNLKEIGLAFLMWADNHGQFPMLYQSNNFDGPRYAMQQKIFVYYQVMSNELAKPGLLACPADIREPATNFAVLRNTNISYFAGLDVDETMPQMFLAGDRNMTTNGIPAASGIAQIKSNDSIGWTMKIHRGTGNIALADGSVQGFTPAAVSGGNSGTNVTRLIFP